VRRFYRDVTTAPSAAGVGLQLDGKAVRTPGRRSLRVPGSRLADAIAAEWSAQGDTIEPHSMPLTGLANAAIDRIAPDSGAFAAGLAQFGESDLLCYRAEGPEKLVARQAEHWDPLLAWARRRYDVELRVTAGIVHQPQPAATVERLTRAVAARDAFHLAGLSPLVTVSGSLIIALAVEEEAVDVATAWAAAALEDHWQLEKWGEDAEAVKALAARRADFEAGARFLALL
jgi:chaperone required for assembly of F1-ATPase